MSSIIIGVRFNHIGKSYHFDATAYPGIKVGDRVVVETSRGKQLGEVSQLVKNPEPTPEGWKPVERIATPRDLVLHRLWAQKELEALITCRERAATIKLSGVKIITAEFSLDGSRLNFLYSTETEGKADLKSLRRDMQKNFPQTQVDLRQIGPRDVAKILGGMGACGLETRCCSKFLSEFSPISIKMAKEQGISLTPIEITGMCGRLRCCLVYEYEQYAAARKILPKRNKRVKTPQGEGKVVDSNPISMLVTVEIPNLGKREYNLDQLQPLDELEALKTRAAKPCSSCDKKE